MTIAAFAEPGKAPLMPGPLFRAPAGTARARPCRAALFLDEKFLSDLDVSVLLVPPD
jgi:hypothetical protein